MTRTRLAVALTVAVVAALATDAAARPALRDAPVPSDWTAWRIEQLAAGVHAFIAPEGVTPIVSGNTLVVIGDDGVLVVDTGQLPSIARHQIAAIKRLTDLPVRWVITTHWHPDHWVGNSAYAAAWPGVTFAATTATRDMIHGKAMGFLTADAQRATADAVRRMRFRAMAPLARLYYRLAIRQLDGYAAELDDATLRPPTLTFDRELVVHLGRREVVVRFLGRGATGGDAVVWIPDAKVAAIGDLANLPYPYAIGSFLGEWPATLAKVRALGAAVILPGHGAPLRDRRYLDQVIALLETVNTQVRAGVAAKQSRDAIRQAIDVATFRDALCGDDPWRRFGFDRIFLDAAVGRAYREAIEGPLRDED